MRRIPHLVIAVVTAALLGALPGHAYAATAVLTIGSVGGSPVPVGDVLSASGPFSFCTSTSGTSCVKCQMSLPLTVTTNPAAPGTATLSATSMSFSTPCTVTIPGITAVGSVTFGLPLNVSIDSSGALTVAGPIHVTFGFTTTFGTVTCAYQAGSLSGSFSNSTNQITFTNQPFSRTSGGGVCPVQLFFSATLGPVVDGTQGNGRVFVN